LFARKADDIADEGNLPDSEKLILLGKYEDELKNCFDGVYKSAFWKALHNTVLKFSIDQNLFFSLLKAFKQDLIKSRFADFEEILEYCKNSANPVGRIILQLHGISDIGAMELSDKICTALQLTNFYQDISQDIEKDRIYLPLDELDEFNVSIQNLFMKISDDNFKQLMKYQIERNFRIYEEGKSLINFLPDKLKMQIRWTIGGGIKILDKIKQIDYNVLKFRPKLSKFDAAIILLKNLR
jgi:squalene synthase HpnC